MKLFLFFFLALLWGGSFIAIKIVVVTVPPFWAAALRLVSALVVIYAGLKIAKKNLSIHPSLKYRVWLSGLTSQAIPFALLFWGERSISPGLGGILNGTTPIFTFIFGIVLLRQDEPFTYKKLFGLLLGISGLVCIFGPKLALGFSNSTTLGTIAVGVMAMSYGLGTIINRSVMIDPNHPDLTVSLLHQTFISSILVCLLALLVEGLPQVVWFQKPDFIISTLYMGWLSTAFAFFIYYKLLNEWGALKASSVAYLIPVSSVLLDFLINKNIPATTDAVGAVVILTGILLLQGRV